MGNKHFEKGGEPLETLSDKKMVCCENMNGMEVYPEKHVREFIKDLKEELMQEGIYGDRDYTIMTIDKLAGEELCK